MDIKLTFIRDPKVLSLITKVIFIASNVFLSESLLVGKVLDGLDGKEEDLTVEQRSSLSTIERFVFDVNSSSSWSRSATNH